MKKLLYITDADEFFRVLNEEKDMVRERLRQLPFAEKIKIMVRMRDIFPRPAAQPRSGGGLAAKEGDTD